MARKKSSNNTFLKVLAGIFLVLAILMLLGWAFNMPQSVFGEEDEDGTKCDLTSSPSITVNGFDTENPGSSLSGIGMYRIEGTNTWNDMSTGSGMSLEVGETYEFYMGLDTSPDEVDNNHGKYFTYTVPCKPAASIEKELAQYEDESGLEATFYNSDGDKSNESMTLGSTSVVSIDVRAGVDEYFGNPFAEGANPNVMCFNLNQTVFADVAKVSVDGTEVSTADQPRRFDSAAGETTYCYEMPVFTDDESTIEITVESDDTNLPNETTDAYIFAGSWTLNSDTGEVSVGVEDEDGNAVATDSAKTVTLDFQQ